ncbi:uncharacterized protein LOC135351045 isoform X2 [Halichondria panicea]|uniref:uncharacterized protein LOC135351045 isoform X2 n=1 Tax=Halichondria panicea TaxID=6063 RepID=UPI00312B40AB
MVKYHQCPKRRILPSLIIAIFWLHLSQEASVNLTVEGGINLLDENCPGIVTLFCEGVDINQLRWRYNEVINIVIYSSDSSPSQSQPSQTAFLSVELVAISQNTVDTNRANFTSILTANLSRLQSDNVMNIECGDAATFQIEPVNVQIIDRSRPRDPRFSMVTTEYQSERLNSVQVQWRKSENFCPDYGLIFFYQVNLTAERSISESVNHNDCPNNFCNVTFSEGITEDNRTIKVSILATSELGPSELICYPYSIDSSAQQYFVPQVSFINNQFQVQCISTALTTSSQNCGVRYTTDPLFRELSDEITPMLDKPFHLPGLSADTTYFFEFTLLVNGSLQVVDRIGFTAQTSTGLPDWGIALIVLFAIFLVALVIIIIVVVVVLLIKTKKDFGNLHMRLPDQKGHSLDEIKSNEDVQSN